MAIIPLWSYCFSFSILLIDLFIYHLSISPFPSSGDSLWSDNYGWHHFSSFRKLLSHVKDHRRIDINILELCSVIGKKAIYHYPFFHLMIWTFLPMIDFSFIYIFVESLETVFFVFYQGTAWCTVCIFLIYHFFYPQLLSIIIEVVKLMYQGLVYGDFTCVIASNK